MVVAEALHEHDRMLGRSRRAAAHESASKVAPTIDDVRM